MKFDEETAQELAKCIVSKCFRNTELENIHTGTLPHTETGDYSDVYVVTPAGKIAWNDVAHISQEQMKELMIDVVNKTYSFLMKMDSEEFLTESITISRRRTRGWNKPELLDKF